MPTVINRRYRSEEHYSRNRANISSSPETNVREFTRMWKDIRKKTIETFSASERAIYEKLQSRTQQEAFVIIRSFNYCCNGSGDFPLAQKSLADRLGISQPGAGYVIQRLIDLRAVKKTADARINSKPATYRWTANEELKTVYDSQRQVMN